MIQSSHHMDDATTAKAIDYPKTQTNQHFVSLDLESGASKTVIFMMSLAHARQIAQAANNAVRIFAGENPDTGIASFLAAIAAETLTFAEARDGAKKMLSKIPF